MSEYHGKDKEDKFLKIAFLGFIIMMFFVAISVTANGETFVPSDQRYIETGQNSNWYYINIHKADNTNEYLGVNKNSRGVIGLADDSEYYGRMWLVPAFQHPTNSKWYLCPIRDVATVNSVTDLGNGWHFDVSDSAVDCYRYDDPTLTGTADLDVQFSMVIDSNAQVKINVNTTVNGISPLDTGFGFLFFPNNQNRYRYIYLNGGYYDLAGADGSVPVDKTFEFFDSSQNPIGHLFDWSDMLDTGNRFAEIVTLGAGGQKGLFIGTYGYGASNFISIDPLYSVDYSPSPSQHLIGGHTHSEPDTDFLTITDITAGVSDNSSATKYMTIAHEFQNDPRVVYKFEETSGDTVEDAVWGDYHEDLNLSGSPNLNIGGASGSGIDFDGSDDFGIRNTLSNISSAEDLVLCVAINDAGVSGTETVIDNKGSGAVAGIELILNPADTINFFVRRGSSQTTLTSTTVIDDSSWHNICGVSLANGTVELYIDGALEDSGSGVTGSLISNVVWHIGETDSGGSRYSQKIDEMCAWVNTGIDENSIIQTYNTSYCGEVDGTVINGKWSQTYDLNYDWWLRVKKENAVDTDLYVFAYDDSDNISDQSVLKNVVGTGWFNTNVSELMDYQLNTLGLNYTSFRIFTVLETNISEIRLLQEANDTQEPTIETCWVDTTEIGCGESVLLQCNVTDDIGVDEVRFQINQTNHTAVQYDTVNFRHSVTATELGIGGIFDWEWAFAKDVVNQWNQTDPNIQINNTCIIDAGLPIGHFHQDAFTIDSENYTEHIRQGFNTPLSTNMVTLTSFNVKRLTGNGTSEVWVRLFVDDVLKTEEKVRTVSSDDEGSTGVTPLRFIVASGDHNISAEFKRTGNGDIEVNDIDVVIIRFLVEGIPIRNEIVNSSFSHSATSFERAFNFTISNSFSTESYILVKQTVSASGSTTINYAIENINTGEISPFAERYLSSDTDVGSMAFVWLDEVQSEDPDYSILAKTSNGATVDVSGNIFNIDLRDGNEHPFNAWQVTNSSTNISNPVTFTAGTHLLASEEAHIYIGDAMFITMTTSVTSLSGSQTPTFIVNSSDPSTDCFSKKERYLSNNNDIGNIKLYTVCNNLTVGNDYTFQLWLKVESGESVSQIDENLVGIEGQQFVLTSYCIENWDEDTPSSCLINDTYIRTFTDNNACGSIFSLPPANGTEGSCNYCSEDLEQVTGTCNPITDTQNVTWTDNNFGSCCFITDIVSDCSINFYPYNETTQQDCQAGMTGLGSIDCQSEFRFAVEEKEYCVAWIPANYSNETFKCISFVHPYDPPNQMIIQTNPEYKERAETFLDYFRGSPESREYFTPANRIVNFYITKKNLLPETEYNFHIQCSSQQRILESSQNFQIGYANFDFVFFRTRWLMANAGYIIGGIIVLFIILAILIVLWKGVK